MGDNTVHFLIDSASESDTDDVEEKELAFQLRSLSSKSSNSENISQCNDTEILRAKRGRPSNPHAYNSPRSVPKFNGFTSYSCPECRMLFDSQGKCKEHIKEIHGCGEVSSLPLISDCISYVCPECYESFDEHEAWDTHLQERHKFFDEDKLNFNKLNNGKVRCNECDRTMSHSDALLKKHKLSHLEYNCYICKICEHVTNSEMAVTRHFSHDHLTDGKYKCSLCDAVYVTGYKCYTHWLSAHSEEIRRTVNSKPNIVCLVDNRQHIARRNRKLNSKCSSAEQSGKEGVQQKQQQLMNMLNPFNMSATVFNISGLISYACSQCNKILISLKNCKVHVPKNHNEIKANRKRMPDGRYLCNNCGIRVKSYQDRKLMPLTYNSFVCKICQNRSRTRSQIMKHLLTHFQMDGRCNFCTESLKSSNDILQHFKTAHKNEYSHTGFYCYTCMFDYGNAIALKNHMVIHNRAKFECLVCNIEYVYLNSLKRHLQSKHPELVKGAVLTTKQNGDETILEIVKEEPTCTEARVNIALPVAEGVLQEKTTAIAQLQNSCTILKTFQTPAQLRITPITPTGNSHTLIFQQQQQQFQQQHLMQAQSMNSLKSSNSSGSILESLLPANASVNKSPIVKMEPDDDDFNLDEEEFVYEKNSNIN